MRRLRITDVQPLLNSSIPADPRSGRTGSSSPSLSPTSNLCFFVYGFAKNERSDIGKDEEIALKKLAAALLTMPYAARARAIRAGELVEVDCDA
jgi:hypothetical protein